MFDTNSIKDNFGRAAESYDAQAHLQRVVRGHALQLAAPLWKAGARVLDVGCGTAALAHEAAEKKWRILHLDISPGMCRLAARSGAAVNADAAALPLKDAAADGVFSSLMLQWANTPRGVFSEMARVLKPGAHAVISTLVGGTLHELKTAFSEVDDAPHVSEFKSAHTLLGYAESAGFSLVSARQVPFVEHYPDMIALMRALQAIGATNTHRARARGLMTPAKMARAERAYGRFADERGLLPATWQALFLVLRKP